MTTTNTIQIKKSSALAIATLGLPKTNHSVLWFLIWGQATIPDSNPQFTQSFISEQIQTSVATIFGAAKRLSENDLIKVTKTMPSKMSLNQKFFCPTEPEPTNINNRTTFLIESKTALIISRLDLTGTDQNLLWFLLASIDPNEYTIQLSQQIIAQLLNIQSKQVSKSIQNLQEQNLISTIQRQPFIAQLNICIFKQL